MTDFRKLRVWQAAQAIAIDAHGVTAQMRGAGSAVLRDQLMRAVMSVPTNIVEGSAHASPREFARFVQYALASLSEVEGHIQLARDVELMTEEDFTPFLSRVTSKRARATGNGLTRKRAALAAHFLSLLTVSPAAQEPASTAAPPTAVVVAAEAAAVERAARTQRARAQPSEAELLAEADLCTLARVREPERTARLGPARVCTPGASR